MECLLNRQCSFSIICRAQYPLVQKFCNAIIIQWGIGVFVKTNFEYCQVSKKDFLPLYIFWRIVLNSWIFFQRIEEFVILLRKNWMILWGGDLFSKISAKHHTVYQRPYSSIGKRSTEDFRNTNRNKMYTNVFSIENNW